jgi:hypothetical protein
MAARGRRAGYATLMVATASVAVVAATATAQSGRPSVNLYGMTGLIDMPTAESQPDAQFVLSYTGFGETSRRNFSFQILPRLSGAIRYATIENWGRRDPDTGERDEGYDLFDRSFDLQFRLIDDGQWVDWMPTVAIGFRDFLGTGVYSGEYLVATKEVYPGVKLTGGVGWGRFAGENTVDNPICTVVDGACDRDNDFGEGGKLSYDTWFRGENVGFFGGVEWLTPVDGLSFKLEYSSDAYKREQQSPRAEFDPESRVNVGVEYRLRDGITLGGYYMYGSEIGFNIAVSGNPKRPITPQDLGSGPLPVNARPADAPRGTGWASNPEAERQLATALAETLDAEGIRLDEARFTGDTVDVVIENQRFNQDPRAIGRTTRVLAAGMPASVETFRITMLEDSIPVTTVEVDRSTFEGQVDRPNAGGRSWETTGLSGAAPSLGPGAVPVESYPKLDWSVAPAPFLVLLTPGDPIRFGLNLDGTATAYATRTLSSTVQVSQPVAGTFSDPGPSDSELPAVRSDTPRYFSGKNMKLARLTGDYVTKASGDIYMRASAGYLERQFAGIGGEVLWKPVDQSWGLGADINYVRQREFDTLFGLEDYDVVTGHASLYWDTGFMGLEAQVDAGRYLAGDWGSTFTLTRRFPNGWAFGAYFTLTDVTEDDFGEGSFDKGVSVSIPFRWTVPFETNSRNTLSLTSVSRDGGARLDIRNRLYPTVRDLDRNRLERNWGSFWQ